MNILYYSFAASIVFVLKFAYPLANAESLKFLLYPVSKILGIATGVKPVFLLEKGYLFEPLQIIVDKSCAGFNFWMICSLMLAFLSINYAKSAATKVFALLSAFLIAYFVTLFVNTARIFVLLITEDTLVTALNLSPSFVHEAIGIATNLTFLVSVYFAAEKWLKHKTDHAKLT